MQAANKPLGLRRYPQTTTGKTMLKLLTALSAAGVLFVARPIRD
jgi:hypothetical protein